MSKKLNVGIIGAGRIGKVHTETLAFRLRDKASIVSITDVNQAAAHEAAARFGVAEVASSTQEMIADSRIDAVVICSSTATHADLVIEAAQAGKHIFCEKPLDLTLMKIDQALAAVAKAGVKLQVGFNRRFDPNFARVRKAVVDGEIGTPQMLHIISRDPSPPPLPYVRASGGIFLDMTIHDFDMARFLIGAEVEEIYTAAAVMVDPAIGEAGDVDTAVMLLRFKNGVIATIDNSRQAVFGYDQRVEIFGSAGSITTGNCYPNEATVSTGTEIRRDLPLNFFMERYMKSFGNEMREFVDCVREDRPTWVTGADARVPVAMALAARKSHDERRPVRLSEVTA